jgi:gliding-associated putative ABC transporter substrate-binding component GldG
LIIGLVVAVILVNVIATVFYSRVDLTEEKRYSLSKPTRTLLKDLDEPVQIDVFLAGDDLPAVVRKFRNALDDYLYEMKLTGGTKIQYHFVNPFENEDTTAVNQLLDSLNNYYGLYPVLLNAPDEVGDKMEVSRLIHGMVVRSGGLSEGVDLLKGARSFGTEPEQLATLYNNVEATIEYKIASAIQKVTIKEKPIVAYALGHGEGWGYNVDDAVRSLAANYRFDTINISQVPYIPEVINAIVILKPTMAFNDADKLKIDQYVMAGGKVLWMIDNMYAEFDSLYKSGGFVAFDRGLNLEDLLFNYGVRINQSLVQDMQSDKLPQVSEQSGQQRMVDWPFFPILNGTAHAISKNLDGVRSLFPTSMDTVEAAGIRKTPLLTSSSNARILTAPAKIDFEFLQIAPDENTFRLQNIPVAYLLEGRFKSLYTGRIPRAMVDSLKAMNRQVRYQADADGKMIVIADGDIAMNQFSPNTGPLPMGMNLFTRYTYANKDFFSNCLEYLVNPSNILETRAKEYSLRLLDPRKVQEQRSTWQLINLVVPVLLVIFAGWLYQYFRKRRFT